MKDNGEDHANRPVKYGVTAADMAALRQRHFEAAELRQAEANLALAVAGQLGERLKRHGDG